jgi:hypothetical protein
LNQNPSVLGIPLDSIRSENALGSRLTQQSK